MPDSKTTVGVSSPTTWISSFSCRIGQGVPGAESAEENRKNHKRCMRPHQLSIRLTLVGSLTPPRVYTYPIDEIGRLVIAGGRVSGLLQLAPLMRRACK